MESMMLPHAVEVCKVARHPASRTSWEPLMSLAQPNSNKQVQDLTEHPKQTLTLVSYHPQPPLDEYPIQEPRSSADGWPIDYNFDPEQFQTRPLSAEKRLHPTVADFSSSSQAAILCQSDTLRPQARVLFLCRQNNARSQMAEALLRHLSNGTIEAYSAGSSPAARIHPLAIRALEAVGIDMYEQYPKHLDRYREKHFDAIVTLCDWVQEVCPTFPDNPVHIHWSFPDPARASGSDEEQYAVFKQTGLQLTPRLRLLMTVLNRKHQQKI